MDIITGYTGSPHVTAEQDRDVNIGIFGAESYVLRTGSRLKAEVSSNNEIKVRDGVIMHQGCAASIKKNTYDSLTIANGSQGMKRVDLIVARYSRDQNTKEESLVLKVIQGTPKESGPAVPGYTTGDIQAGDLIADMPLYQVTLNGLNITEVKQLFATQDSIAELSSNLLNVKADLTKANNNIAIINSNLISIVERGTKNNYNYTKYSNGDMVMWSKYTWNTNLATSWYNWYFASSAAVGFPVAFKQAPLIIVSPAKTNELYGLGVAEVTTTGYKLTAYSPKQGMCYVQADMLIIGKWK
ncbi:hypothetical protein G4346_00300 [Coprococcus comes]|nr:hypothetical protein [Coprococcus comes]NSF07464.1 hypothetical protein [Coprococcus comes]